MAEEIRWGILGCGRIARKFASDLEHVHGSKLLALGSRSRSDAICICIGIPRPAYP